MHIVLYGASSGAGLSPDEAVSALKTSACVLIYMYTICILAVGAASCLTESSLQLTPPLPNLLVCFRLSLHCGGLGNYSVIGLAHSGSTLAVTPM